MSANFSESTAESYFVHICSIVSVKIREVSCS
jgi:hypothetical protein